MCILADALPRDTPTPQTHAAHLLPPLQRQQLALAALAGTQPLAHLAQQHDVSRKFVAQQRDQAHDALTQAFALPSPDAQDVLFALPVTRSWLSQFVLALLLICHSALRGVHELLRDLFDYHLSLGSLHNLVQQAMAKATARNAQQDLSRVLVAALDEIFQGRQPVLTVVDAASTYCCLLTAAEHRDADTGASTCSTCKRKAWRLRPPSPMAARACVPAWRWLCPTFLAVQTSSTPNGTWGNWCASWRTELTRR